MENVQELTAAFDPSLETLSEDCVFEILDRLPINYLYTIAETCSRLSDLAAIRYRRLRPEKYASLEVANGKIVVSPNDHDVQMFGRKFLNLKIRCDSRHLQLDKELLQFISTNCSTSLQTLRFENVMLQKKHLEALSHMLHRVETLVLHKCGMNEDFFDCTLRHFHNLQQLIISDTYTSNGIRSKNQDGINWLLLKYPKLQSVQICTVTMVSFQQDYWQMFFRRNPQIKRFSCDHWISTDPFDRPVKILWRDAPSLTHLYISLCGIGHLNNTYSDLAGLCRQNTFQRLEVQFTGCVGLQYLYRHLKILCSMEKLQALHLSNMNSTQSNPTNILLTKDAAAAIASFVHLKQLNFINTTFDNEFAEIVSKKLINLEEIYSDAANDFTPFIRNSPKLNKIILPKSPMGELNLGWGLLWLNEERIKIRNPCQITIYVQDISTGNAEVEVFSSGIITIQTIANDKRKILQVKNTFIHF